MEIEVVYNKALTTIKETVRVNTSSEAIVSAVRRLTHNALFYESFNDYLNIGDDYIVYENPRNLLTGLSEIVDDDCSLTEKREVIRVFVSSKLK